MTKKWMTKNGVISRQTVQIMRVRLCFENGRQRPRAIPRLSLHLYTVLCPFGEIY